MIKVKLFLNASAAALLLGTTLGLAAPVMASEGFATAGVKLEDLNLSTVSGQRALARRTASAIEVVCPLRGSIASAPRADARVAHRECARSVRVSVQQQLGEQGTRALALN